MSRKLSLTLFLWILFLDPNTVWSQSESKLLIMTESDGRSQPLLLSNIEQLTRELRKQKSYSEKSSFSEVFSLNNMLQNRVQKLEIKTTNSTLKGQTILFDPNTIPDDAKTYFNLANYVLRVYIDKINDQQYQFDLSLSELASVTEENGNIHLNLTYLKRQGTVIHFGKESEPDKNHPGKLIYETKLLTVLKHITENTFSKPGIRLFANDYFLDANDSTGGPFFVEVGKTLSVDAGMTSDDDTPVESLSFYWKQISKLRMEYDSYAKKQEMVFNDMGTYTLQLTVSDGLTKSVKTILVEVVDKPSFHCNINRKLIQRQQSIFSFSKTKPLEYNSKISLNLQSENNIENVDVDITVLNYAPEKTRLKKLEPNHYDRRRNRYTNVTENILFFNEEKNGTVFSSEYKANIDPGRYTILLAPKVKGTNIRGDSVFVPLRYSRRPLAYISTGLRWQRLNSIIRKDSAGGIKDSVSISVTSVNLRTLVIGFDVYLFQWLRLHSAVTTSDFERRNFPDEESSPYRYGLHFGLYYDRWMHDLISTTKLDADEFYTSNKTDFIAGVFWDMQRLGNPAKKLFYNNQLGIGIGVKKQISDEYSGDIALIFDVVYDMTQSEDKKISGVGARLIVSLPPVLRY